VASPLRAAFRAVESNEICWQSMAGNRRLTAFRRGIGGVFRLGASRRRLGETVLIEQRRRMALARN
jgi:hypothetical protein